jgi:protein-S-isoprenylcysteine O-methyltransferase Ste14
MEQKSDAISEIGWRMIVRFLIYVVFLPLVLFIAAGTLDWMIAWVFVVIHIFFALYSRYLVYRTNPDTLVERARSTQREDTAGRDRYMVFIVGLLGPLLIWIVAGLNKRFGWPPEVARPLQLISIAGVVFGYVMGTWAMVTNAYFSAVVRIQEDRGHTVVTDGPYRFVRHPAYSGGLVSALTMPLMLGSFWALVPSGIMIIALIYRTKVEDQMLMDELPGYQAFATRTRFRLIPGIW